MQLPEVDLLGDPTPEPLPEDVHLTDLQELVGHTIKAAIESGAGRFKSDVVLVTETGCWLVLSTELDGCGADAQSYIRVQEARSSWSEEPPYVLHDFASATDLLAAGCINSTEHAALREVELARERDAAAKKASFLRAQLERAEREAGIAPQSPKGST